VAELALVFLFTAAGIGAALLALRLADDSRLIRWLVWGFCLLAVANLALHVWPVLAGDPGGAARIAAIAFVLVLLVWAYRRLLRALRHRADAQSARHQEDGQQGAGQQGAGRRHGL
jgi:hypothetical protein